MRHAYVRASSLLATSLSLCFTALLLLLSFDSFGEEGFSWTQVVGFLIHNIPTIVILSLALVARTRHLVGAIGFLVVAVLFIILFGKQNELTGWLLLSGVPILIAILHCIAWFGRKRNDS